MGRLTGRIAMVTGGGRGIGQGISTVLAREGASLVIADIDLDNAERTAATLGNTFVVHCDVSDAASAEDALTAAIRRYGRLDILVNNAGVVGSHLGAAATEDDWDVCYEVNVKGIWNMTRAAVPHFDENGGGRVVNIASIAGRKGTGGLPHYCASKAAAISLTQSLAHELGPRNITVNAVCPGLLWTDMWRNLEGMIGANDTPEVVERREIFERYLETNCPLRREQTPEDIGEAVAFFASDAAKNITGQSLNVDGGIEMS